jgi:hypothetical protein
MSSVFFLTSSNFNLIESKGKVNMHIKLPDISLVLFYTNKCQHCKGFKPIFMSLPGRITGCHIGMLDVERNFDTIRMSKQTSAPIDVVPYIILYVNRKPYMRYKGPANQDELIKFVVTVYNQLKASKQSQHRSQLANVKPQQNSSIPSFCIAQPKTCDGDVCYLDFPDAYKDMKSKPKPKQGSYESARR